MLASLEYNNARPAYSSALAEWVLNHQGRAVSRALDIGCGTGRSSLWARSFSEEVVGIDNSAEMLAIARQVNDDPAISFCRGSAEDFGNMVAPADLILSASAFEWFDKEAFAKEAVRATGPSCRVVVAWSWLEPQDDVTRRWYWLMRHFLGAQAGPDANDAQAMAWAFFPESPQVTTVRTRHRYDVVSLQAFVRSSSYWKEGRPRADAELAAQVEKFVHDEGDIDGTLSLVFREVGFMGELN